MRVSDPSAPLTRLAALATLSRIAGEGHSAALHGLLLHPQRPAPGDRRGLWRL